jgi:hypothetical protein
MTPDSVREVSATMAAWLIAEGYAEPEMRHAPDDEAQEFFGRRPPVNVASELRRRRRRRSGDR